MAARLAEVLDLLERIAPLELAQEWDNVGLLIGPVGDVTVTRCLVTIDLTDSVLDEAVDSGCEVIVAYHPPIFAPLRRLTERSATERRVLRAVRAGLAVYSPHTALDAAPGGVNDWLADGLGPGQRTGIAVEPEETGQGLEVRLDTPAVVDDVVARIKRHLALAQVRVATAARHRDGSPVETVALCAGAGGSVLAGRAADLFWTGEMRHHDVLAALEAGTSVVLCEHTNTERGYLPVLRDRLAAGLAEGTTVAIAGSDREPLQVL